MLFFKWPSIIELKQCVMPTDESQSHSNFFLVHFKGTKLTRSYRLKNFQKFNVLHNYALNAKFCSNTMYNVLHV